jgi:hypothetical protein
MRFVIYHLEVTSWHIDHAGGIDTGMTWLVVRLLVCSKCPSEWTCLSTADAAREWRH